MQAETWVPCILAHGAAPRYADGPRLGDVVNSVFVYEETLARTSLGPDHPFKPSRAVRLREICEQLGLLGVAGTAVVAPRAIDPAEVLAVHDTDYVDALRRANDAFHEDLLRYNLGRAECPVFPGVFDYALGCVAATLTGLRP